MVSKMYWGIRRKLTLPSYLRPWVVTLPAERLVDVEAIRAAYNKEVKRMFTGRFDALKSFAYHIIWPIRLLYLSVKTTLGQTGSEVALRYERNRLEQIFDQIQLGLKYHISPEYYYMYQLYEPARRKMAQSYVQQDEIWNLQRRINRITADSPISDKLQFDEFCKEHTLNHIPIIAVLGEDKPTFFEGKVSLPKIDMFAKPIRGYGGNGACIIRYNNGGYCINDQMEVYDENGLLAAMRERRWEGEDFVLQPYVSSASLLQDLAPKALSGLRVITTRPSSGEVSIEWVMFKIPGVNAVGDNFHTGGMAALVISEDGKLGPAFSEAIMDMPYTHHPTTGVPILGRVIPDYEQALALARRAHESADLSLVGWDVAITDQGPLLIEGNAEPSFALLQRMNGHGIGGTRFGKFLENEIRLRELA